MRVRERACVSVCACVCTPLGGRFLPPDDGASALVSTAASHHLVFCWTRVCVAVSSGCVGCRVVDTFLLAEAGTRPWRHSPPHSSVCRECLILPVASRCCSRSPGHQRPPAVADEPVTVISVLHTSVLWTSLSLVLIHTPGPESLRVLPRSGLSLHRRGVRGRRGGGVWAPGPRPAPLCSRAPRSS